MNSAKDSLTDLPPTISLFIKIHSRLFVFRILFPKVLAPFNYLINLPFVVLFGVRQYAPIRRSETMSAAKGVGERICKYICTERVSTVFNADFFID